MRALVLAAGRGERLRPLTDSTPKPLLEVGGHPLVHYPLLMLKAAGIVQIAINVHHLAGRFETTLGDGGALGLEITYAPEPVLLGTGGPLLKLKDFFGAEPFVVANADTILDLDLRAMIALHRERDSLVTLALCRPDNAASYSRLEIDGDGRLRRIRLIGGSREGEFEDFPALLDARLAASLHPYMYCGLYICEPAVFELMPKSPPFASFRDLFAPMVARGMALHGFVHRGFFRTADDLEAYRALGREFAADPPRLGYLR